ncbi:MAG: VacJ family lipoprotein [Pseudomonadota bacterium]|nr:VacJ family lipoprotein [Pseudomonadota bacterium]
MSAADTENDPFEKTNRAIFEFNNTLDDNFFKPVAKAWRKVPDFPRKPLSNLATTAKTPISLANAILQLNRESMGNIIGKFLINMTFGLGGLFDVAGTQEFGSIPTVEEDFGQTMATWGVPDGPYVMLPVFGPSSIRDSIGIGVDAITNPLSFAYRMNGIGLEARLSGPVVRGVSTREKYLDYVDEMRESSLDWYATMRSLYRQKRKKEISGELEEEKVSLNILPIDVYDDPKLEESIATTLNEDKALKENSTSKNEESEKVFKKDEKIVKKISEKKTMPSDGYANPEGGDKNKFVDNSEITKIVRDESRKIMPAPRVYNGVLPSSSYPGFSKSRVNLIN